MIEGESGIGKSTLAQRFSTAIQLDGAACARVQCFELEQRIPFGMIGTLVTNLLDRPGVAGTEPAALAELGRLVPRVRERFTQLPPPRGAEGEAARVLFAEGFFAMLESLVEEQPVALIVDDYPRSDEASLSVLHMLLRRPGLHQVMVVLTARPAEPGEPAQAQRIRRGVASLGLQQLKLEPLAEADSNALLDALVSPTGRWLKPPERRAILRAGAGNPLAIELLAQDWIAHGDAAVVLSLPAMQAEVPATAFDVSAFDRAVDRLVPSLSRRGRAALWIATILGPRLNDLSFFALVDLEDHRLIAALAELTACRILREVGGRLEFSNELMRARLYLQVPSGIRIELHKRVAERLIEADAKGQKISGLEIAWHCVRARRPAIATPYLMQGARRAIATGASDEAARALSSALKHLKGRDRDEGIILLAETLQEMADWKGSMEVLEEIERKRKIDPELGEIRDCMILESKRRLGHFSRDEMVGIVLDSLSNLSRLKSQEASARCLLFAAKAGSALRDDVIWNAMSRVRIATGGSSISTRLQGMASLARALTSYYLGHHEEALSILHESTARLNEESIADTVAALLHTGIGAVCCAIGHYESAVHDTERALAIATRLDNDDLVLSSAANLALCHLRLGQYDKARDISDQAATRWLNRGERPGFDAMRAILHGGLGAAYANNRDQAEQAAARAAALVGNMEHYWEKQFALFMLADLLWLLDRRRDALRAAKQALRLSSGPAVKQMIGVFARWSAILAARSCDRRTTLDLLCTLQVESERIDAIDKLELDCAILHLRNTMGDPIDSQMEEIRLSLTQFPVPVSYQLVRLGILASCRVTKSLPEATLRS
jgi:tetratricopeptide (TPR) repeat protein